MRVLHLLIIITALIVGVSGGYVTGRYKAEQDSEKLFYMGEAIVMTGRVQALSAIRKGKSEEAANWLEHSVDGNLIVLGPYMEIALKENNTIVLSSLKLASMYRDLYKNEYKAIESENPDVASSIKEALDFGEIHGEYTHMNFIKKYLNPNQSLNQDAQ